MDLTAQLIASLTDAELRGNADAAVTGVAPIDRATHADVTFVRDPAHARALADSDAGVAIIARAALDSINDPDAFNGTALVIVDDADAALASLLRELTPDDARPAPGVHPTACIDPDADVDPTASIGPMCVVERTTVVGPRTVLHPGVVVRRGVRIGADCEIGPNAVLGAEGFGYVPNPSPASPGEALTRVPHVGGVVLGDFVEVGACTTIDRGKLGDTTIGTGTKIDNLVQIAHNCRIGACCILCGRVGLSGSVVLGDGVQLAGGVGMADNLTVGDRSRIGAGSGVKDNIPADVEYVGYPAIPAREFFRRYAFVTKLMKKRNAERAAPDA